MRRVIIESPFAGNVAENVAYAKAVVRDCLERGEAPIASHLLFTQDGILKDDQPEQRAQGIAAGIAWGLTAEAVVVYIDRGISGGMMLGIETYRAAGLPIELRRLPTKGKANE